MCKESSIFNKSYWKSAADELKDVKIIAFAALILALNIVMQGFFVPVGESLRVYFTFIIKGIGCMVFGPVVALCYGFIGDILGYIMFPTGGFFPGYTISSMLGVFIYALFFYKSKITVMRIFLAKLTVNVFVNIILGSVWSAILYSKGYYYYFAKSIIKNLTLLPFEVILMVIVFQIMIPIIKRSGIIKNDGFVKIPFI